MRIEIFLQQENKQLQIELSDTATLEDLLVKIENEIQFKRQEYRLIHKGKIISQERTNLTLKDDMKFTDTEQIHLLETIKPTARPVQTTSQDQTQEQTQRQNIQDMFGGQLGEVISVVVDHNGTRITNGLNNQPLAPDALSRVFSSLPPELSQILRAQHVRAHTQAQHNIPNQQSTQQPQEQHQTQNQPRRRQILPAEQIQEPEKQNQTFKASPKQSMTQLVAEYEQFEVTRELKTEQQKLLAVYNHNAQKLRETEQEIISSYKGRTQQKMLQKNLEIQAKLVKIMIKELDQKTHLEALEEQVGGTIDSLEEQEQDVLIDFLEKELEK
ncbi:Conserved_hypothetical protein [Hexamita inflata]|uniref:Ubiquitin-like domain-containing protein n=1 Tax=Hexamita inflata TaxID=28002 RepID=A0AA86NUV0_9EUKA|nr:Conserved hypothetical protein [Hexamita inflata]